MTTKKPQAPEGFIELDKSQILKIDMVKISGYCSLISGGLVKMMFVDNSGSEYILESYRGKLRVFKYEKC